MKTNKIFLIVALLGTVLAGCQKVEKEIDTPVEQPATGNVWKLVVQATKDADTKALNYDGTNNTLDAYWKKDETVDVYLVGGDKVGTLSVTSEDNVDPATLEGDIETDDLSVGDNLWLLFPGTDKSWSYLDQNGSAPDAAFDYATASVKVEKLDNTNKTITTSTENTTFANQQSVYRFGFKVSGSAIAVKSFTLFSAGIVRTRSYNGNDWASEFGSITATPTLDPADHLYFMSVRNENTESTNNYSFSVIGRDNALYEGEKAINKQLQNGKLYNASVNITQKTFSPNSTEANQVL
jgi:hypothetical protein